MLALPLTPKSPGVLDFDCAPPRATPSPKLVVPSYERPPSPSIFTSMVMTATRSQPASQKRPKLSLQTSSLPITFGKSSTALKITASTHPVASPTVLNTFNNAYDIPHRSSPATASPTGAKLARPSSRLVSPFASSKEDRPYQIAHGLKSILRNGPIPSGLRRSSLCPATESPRTARRAFFPAVRKVTFRVILEEEIKTSTYTARHSDLSSDEEDSDSDEQSELSLSSSDESDVEELAQVNTDAGSTQLRRKRKAGSDRQIQAAAIRDCIVDAAVIRQQMRPKFELQGKRRRRHWKWTLEPLKGVSLQADTGLQLKKLDPSPTKIQLSLSAGLDRHDTLLSPSNIALPPSATLVPTEGKPVPPSSTQSSTLLPHSATIPSSTSSAADINTEEDKEDIAADPLGRKR
ncbi:hypothetical protein GJ744_002764 [Endocarpon pusillum]|uniref:Uncharacterized protein n=1 Tax=Endocarpon pusillum TaxID=364733 RepID=A0A8H7E9T9_9EURO|nr:hypothetical protein GJ744_002764 [Endocarpon pusillum]